MVHARRQMDLKTLDLCKRSQSENITYPVYPAYQQTSSNHPSPSSPTKPAILLEKNKRKRFIQCPHWEEEQGDPIMYPEIFFGVLQPKVK